MNVGPCIFHKTMTTRGTEKTMLWTLSSAGILWGLGILPDNDGESNTKNGKMHGNQSPAGAAKN